MEKVTISNSQGKGIAAVIHRPEKHMGKLAILCPGRLDSKDYTHLVELAKTLAAHGYTAIRFDPTGTWESEGTLAEYTNFQYLNDVQSVLAYMLSKGDYYHILLGGHSRGGEIAILYAARDTRIFAVLAIMPGASNLQLSAQRRAQWEQTGFEVSQRDLPDKTGTREFLLPFSHLIDRERYNVLEDVNKIRVPLILVAGELDTIVPPEDVKRIFDEANQPKQFILMPGIGHDYRHNFPEIEKVNNEIVQALCLSNIN